MGGVPALLGAHIGKNPLHSSTSIVMAAAKGVVNHHDREILFEYGDPMNISNLGQHQG